MYINEARSNDLVFGGNNIPRQVPGNIPGDGENFPALDRDIEWTPQTLPRVDDRASFDQQIRALVRALLGGNLWLADNRWGAGREPGCSSSHKVPGKLSTR